MGQTSKGLKMPKITKQVTIDQDVFIWATVNIKNFSQEVNDYFRMRMAIDKKVEIESKAEVLKEIDELKKASLEISWKMLTANMELTQILEKEKEIKEIQEKERVKYSRDIDKLDKTVDLSAIADNIRF
jgi:SMC interacting uncharacterized protein involved in chromosome segregation